MLVIRKEQLAVFEEARKLRFEQRALQMLCETLDLKADDHRLRDLVHACWVKSQHYGILNEFDVMLLVGMAYFHGVDFDEDPRRPWIAELLADPNLNAQSKFRAISVRLAREARQEANVHKAHL